MCRKSRTIAFSLLLLALVGLSSCGSNKPAAIKVDQTLVNLDTIWRDDAVKTISVNIRNTGDQDLKITDVSTDCDCTTVDFFTKTIKGGDDADLKITLDLSGFFPMEVEKKVFISSNAPGSPTVITLKGLLLYEK